MVLSTKRRISVGIRKTISNLVTKTSIGDKPKRVIIIYSIVTNVFGDNHQIVVSISSFGDVPYRT